MGGHGYAVGGPLDSTAGIDPLDIDLGIDIGVDGAAAGVIPRDDGSPQSIGGDSGVVLIAIGAADGYAVAGPLDSTAGVHPLGINVTTATAGVLLGSQCSVSKGFGVGCLDEYLTTDRTRSARASE